MARKLPDDLQSVAVKTPLSSEVERRLRAASVHDFRLPVTAYLTDAVINIGFCKGVVWGHERARNDAVGTFANGHTIHTSDITSFEEDGGFWVIGTLNSRYVIVSFKPNVGRMQIVIAGAVLTNDLPTKSTVH